MLAHARAFVFMCYGVPSRDGPLPLGLPSSLGREDLPLIWGGTGKPYVVSPKADGTRQVMGTFVANNGQSVCFIMDRAGKRGRRLEWLIHPNAYAGSLLDMEVVQMRDGREQLWVFDCIRYCNHDVHTLPYHLRLAAAMLFLNEMMLHGQRFPWPIQPDEQMVPLGDAFAHFVEIPGYTLSVKPVWYHTGLINLDKWTQGMYEHLPVDNNAALVYTPLFEAVAANRSLTVKKWKSLHTVDFLVTQVADNDSMMDLSVTDADGQVIWYARCPLDSENHQLVIIPNCIYECRLQSNKDWIVIRPRPEKTRPNAQCTVDATCRHIAQNLQFIDLTPIK